MDELLNTLSLSEQNSLVTYTLEKNRILFAEEEYCDCIGILVDGELVISSVLLNGKEVIYNRLKKNDVFGNNLLFSSHPYYKGDVKAATFSRVVLIPKEKLLVYLQSNTEFLQRYLEIQSDFGKSLNERIRLLSFDSAEDRLVFFLKENNNQYTYPSISEFAALLFLSRETLSRLLARMEKEKRICREKKTIFLNSKLPNSSD